MKYITRMEDVVVVNHWCLWQVHSIIIPYLKEYKKKNVDVSITQLPRQLHKLTLEDFLQTSAIETLKCIKTHSEDRELSDSLSNSQNEVNVELKLSDVIGAYFVNKTWPVIRFQFKHFNDISTGLHFLGYLEVVLLKIIIH